MLHSNLWIYWAIGCHPIHFSRLRVSGHLFEQFTTQKAKLLKIHSDFSNFLSPKKVFLLFPKPFPILSWIKKFFNFFKREIEIENFVWQLILSFPNLSTFFENWKKQIKSWMNFALSYSTFFWIAHLITTTSKRITQWRDHQKCIFQLYWELKYRLD